MPQFIIIGGKNKGESFTLDKDKVRIGRFQQNDVVLSDTTVSRFHAEVINRDGNYFIKDLQSTHGTYVNGVRNISEALIKNDDIIRMGDIEMLFKIETPEAVEQVVSLSISTDRAYSHEFAGKQWKMLSEVAEATMSIFEIEDLLEALMDMLFEVFKPDRGVIFLYEEPADVLKPKIVHPKHAQITVSQTIINQAVEKRLSLLFADTAAEQSLKIAKSIMAESIRSAICSPLVRKDKVLGVIYLDAQSHLLTYVKEDLALLNIIAVNAAISIENALLIKDKIRAERLAAVGIAISGISHYVKNIITGIVGSESLIDEGLRTEKYDIIKEIWPIQKRSTHRISTLVQDMLTYSKERIPAWESGNLNTLLREIHEDQMSHLEKENVKLILDLAEDLPDSEFDPKAIYDTVLNMVGNAIDACSDKEEGEVILRSFQPDEKHVAVWIIDNGAGIPQEIQERIFEPFFSTKGSRGTGLGLAVARKSIEEHHGSLVLESYQGEGTTFKITLPISSK